MQGHPPGGSTVLLWLCSSQTMSCFLEEAGPGGLPLSLPECEDDRLRASLSLAAVFTIT